MTPNDYREQPKVILIYIWTSTYSCPWFFVCLGFLGNLFPLKLNHHNEMYENAIYSSHNDLKNQLCLSNICACSAWFKQCGIVLESWGGCKNTQINQNVANNILEQKWLTVQRAKKQIFKHWKFQHTVHSPGESLQTDNRN